MPATREPASQQPATFVVSTVHYLGIKIVTINAECHSASEPVGDCWYPLEHAEKLTSQERVLHCRIEYLASRLDNIFRSVDKITGIVTE